MTKRQLAHISIHEVFHTLIRMKLVLKFQDGLESTFSVRRSIKSLNLGHFERVASIVDPPLAFVDEIFIEALADYTNNSIIYN